MPGNRVDKLEAKVSELESTIDGLVTELLESKDRIRELETELEEATSEPDPEPEPEPETDEGQFDEAAPEEVKEAAAQADARSAPPEPEADAGETFEAAKDDEHEETDERTESGLGDDIIVA